MNIHSKSINANDLNGVYDYFDNVVNLMIRNELDTENFPTLQEFAGELAVLIDRLDALCDDINPRVEAYLASKAEEEQLKRQLEEIQAKLGNNRESRRSKFGGSESEEGGGIYEKGNIYDSDGPYGASSFRPENTSAVKEGPSIIDFTTDIEDLMGDDDEDDTDELRAKELFDDRAAEELLRRQRENTIDDDELMNDLEQALDPMSIFSGQREMDAKGDHYTELIPEVSLYDEDEEEEDRDPNDTGFGFGFPGGGDYSYEDDGNDTGNSGYFAGGDSAFGTGDNDDDDWGTDDEFDDDYRDDYRSGTGRLDEDDDWDEGDDPFGGRNIDQLLSSANMTI